jgi:hypothetical protein
MEDFDFDTVSAEAERVQSVLDRFVDRHALRFNALWHDRSGLP